MVGRTEYGSITSKRVVLDQPIYKMGVSKKKNGLNGDGETLLTKSEETPATPKVSVRQLFRYASCSDVLLIFVGIIVSIGTGLGWPLMSVVMGNISRNFMTIGTRLASNYTEDELPLIYDDFNKDAMKSCIAYLYLGCGVFIVGTLQAVCFLTVSENVVNRLRREFFKGILRQDVTWFDQNNSGTVATKLFDNIERVKEGTGDKLGLMLQYIAQFFGGFAVAFLYDWKLTLIMMSLTPFMIISGATIAKIMSSAATREAKKYAVAGGIAEEVLTSMRTVIAFNGQERESQRYEKALEAGKLIGIKKSLFQGAGMGMMFFIMFSSYCLAFWVGTNFVYEGRMDGGTVMTVFFAVMLGSMALGQAGPQFAVLGTALGAAGALYQIIDRTPEIDSYSTAGLKPKDMKGKLVVKDVRFTYPTRKDVKVLKGVSFEANPGETIALVGSSGCGKSTIIQLLLRYYDPESGSITIDGVEINKLNIDFLRNFIGVVSQEPTLFNTTIEQNIRYGNWDVTDAELSSALRRANAYNFIKSFPDGIKTLVGDHGTQMSGGQKQRIAIARALVRDPKILLLDEATSALDAESEHIVQQALENASKGRTTIVIAHRLSTIRNADKIIAMKEGEVLECGTHEELLSRKGLYHDLVNSQVFVDNVKEESDTVKRMESVLSARSQASTTDGKETHRMKSQFSDSPDQSEDTSTKKNSAKDLERLKKELEAEGAAKASLWKIVAYARSEWPLLLIAVLCACLMGCVMPVFSILFTQIIAVFSNPDPEQMKADGHVLALMFLALGISQGLFIMGQAFFFGLSAERITLRIRSKVFRNIMRMDGAYFDMPTHSPGKITTRLATDAPNVKSAIDYRLGTVFNSAIAICFGLAIAFYFGWQMAVVVLAIFPLAGVGRSIQIKYVSGNAGSDAAEMENSGKVAMEAIENVRTVQALTLEKRLYSQFCSHLDRPHRNNQRKAVMQGFAYGFAASIIFFLYGASFRWGLWLIAHQYMTPIRVLRVLFAISFCAGSLGTASAYFPEYIKATFAAGLIFKMLEEEPGIDNLSKKGKKSEVSGKIELHNVFFRYPQRPEIPILQGLNLKVTPGETLALVGPSGCGKSTVISLLERLYDTLDGQVLLDETDIRELNPAHMRSHIALVSQEPLLFDTTIRENITYGMEPESINDEKVIEVAKKANIHSFIEQLSEGYDTRVGEKGTQLSGGQKQRIAIARALIRNPKILLLDEATSALDTESEQLVQSALDKASEGRTCIVVAHRLSTIVNANCIMVVSDGKVVEQGSHQELIAKRGAYYKLNQRQNLSA